jgi:uncharacterized repeat protein (TIGR01451 family)
MHLFSDIKFRRLLPLILICLVFNRADFSFAAAEETTEPVTTTAPVVSDPVVVDAAAVQDSVESYLEAVAINGVAIMPTAYPEADLGDVITFRIRIHNTHAGTLRLLQCGASWGRGFVYQGNLTVNRVQCRYDEQEQKIDVDIKEIIGMPEKSVVVGERLSDSTCWYMFDLKVASCKDLSVHVLTDELYSCQSDKIYYTAPRITTPEIRYSLAFSPEKFVAGQKQPVTLTFRNAGDGTASDLTVETNLERFFVIVDEISPGFVYDAESGTFLAGEPVEPGRSVTLKFALQANRNADDPLPEDMTLFRPVYADNCDLRLQAPETVVLLRPAGENPADISPPGINLGLKVDVGLPEVVKDCEIVEATINIKKTTKRRLYDLEVVLDTTNYTYLDDLITTGFDGRTPRVHTSRAGVVVFSFDADPDRAEPLTQGGSLRFKVLKKCSHPPALNATARFIHPLDAEAPKSEEIIGPGAKVRKREVSAYAGPLLNQAADLAVRVTPESCRLEPGQPMPWNIYVTNRGNATAFDVTVEDLLPDNLVFQKHGQDAANAPEIKENMPASGQTTLKWKLGELAPSRTRKVTVVAMLRPDKDSTEVLVGTANNIRVFSGCQGDACQENEKTAPIFILPDDCVSDVYEKPEKVHGFLGVALIYKSNLYDTYRNPKGVWATYITPGFWLALPASHERLVEIATTSATPGGLAVSPFFPKNDRLYQAYLLYSPQWEFYHNESQNNMVTQRLDSYFHYNSRNKLTLQLIDQFKRAHDSVSSRTYNIEDRYKTNLFSAVSTLNLTKKFEMRLDYSNFLVDYDASENSSNDRMDNSWALYGYFHLTDKTSLFAEYEYADLDYRRNNLDCIENRYFGGIRWEFTEKTSGQIKGGVGARDFDDPGLMDVSTWMAEFIVDYDMTERTRIVVNAYRRYEEAMSEGLHWDNYSGHVSTNMLTHMVGLSLSYDLTSKLHLNLHSTLFYDAYAYEYQHDLWNEKKRRDREFALSPMIKLDFLKWLTFDLAYTYTHVDSNYAQAEVIDHTVLLRGTLYR